MNNTPQLENGYTKIANEILEHLFMTHLTSYQTRIVFCILRKTYGFNKTEDWISNSQFVSMTGLRPSHISRAVSELLRMNIITKRGNKTAFQKDWRLWKELPNGVRRHDVTKRGNTVTKRGNSLLPNGGNTKETITKETYTKEMETHQKIEYLTKIPDEEVILLSKGLAVNAINVRRKGEELFNYCQAKGRKYKNYRAVLRNALIKDFGYKFNS